MDQDWTLVGDIGGTNARFSLVKQSSKQLEHVQKKACVDFPRFIDAVQSYVQEVGIRPSRICLATAGPVSHLDEEISFTNNPWAFKRREMFDELGVQEFKVINDFVANALAIPELEHNEKVLIGQTTGEVQPHGPILILGPGTGLGMASLIEVDGQFIPCAGEGGHVSFAPTTDEEVEIWKVLRHRYGRVSAERLLSGQGLKDLFNIKSHLYHWGVQVDTPAQVTELSMEQDSNALQVVKHFCKILGDVAGDAALTVGASGGVYICGGIAPRIIPILQQGDFRHAFEDKGRMKVFVDGIQTWVVTSAYPGLLGSLAAMRNSKIL